MIDNKYHEEYTYKKKRVVVDIARLPSYAHPEGIYEVMAYYKGKGKELAMLRTPDFEKAVSAYQKMLLDFPADKLEEQPFGESQSKDGSPLQEGQTT